MSATVQILTGAAAPEWRAAGTDVSERRRSGVAHGAIRDVVTTAEMRTVSWGMSGAGNIGAAVSIAAIAADARIAASYPGIAATAAGLATPQIRNLATLGGSLAQKNRCWYYRNPHVDCLKKGGTACPARSGNHLYGVAFDLGPCVAPHPSSMAVALLAYGATVTTDRRSHMTISDFVGDGTNGTAHNMLASGELIVSIDLPPPATGERATYKRAIGRAHAEWPQVELVVRTIVSEGTVQFVRIVAGGIAPVPLRLTAAEAAVQGGPAASATIAEAARQSIALAKPLAQTGYKLALLRGLVQDLLEQNLIAAA